MEKQGAPSAPIEQHSFPQAPPSYDEAVSRQPAYNPQFMPVPMQQAPPPAIVNMPMPTQVVRAPLPTVALAVGPNPAAIECPHCHKHVRTSIRTEAQKSAHVAALLLFLCGCWCCCCIPYCLSAFQDVHHKCPECKAFIGTYKH